MGTIQNMQLFFDTPTNNSVAQNIISSIKQYKIRKIKMLGQAWTKKDIYKDVMKYIYIYINNI